MKKLNSLNMLFVIGVFVITFVSVMVTTTNRKSDFAYADTIVAQTLVTFDEESISPTFVDWGDSDYNFQIPSNEIGRKFQGWFYNGQQYTDSNGKAVKVWDLEKESVTLNAKWQTSGYTLQTIVEGQTYYYTVLGGWTKNSASRCMSGTGLKSVTQIEDDFRSDVKIDNLILNYFTLNGKLFSLTENKMPFFEEGIYTLTPIMVEEIHTIYFDSDGGIINRELLEAKAGDDIGTLLSVINCTRENYVFEHWEIVESNGNSFLLNTKLESFMPDCTKEQRNGSIKVKAIWADDEFHIEYVLNGGINSLENPSVYTKSDIIRLSPPSKDHYLFDGWFLDAAFTEPISVINNFVGDLTIYARWVPGVYTIKVKKDDKISIIKTASYGTSFNLPVFEKAGYYGVFRNILIDGVLFNVEYQGGASFTILGNTLLNVVWVRNDIKRTSRLRGNEITIYDSGDMNNKHDLISLKTLTGYTLSELKAKGYKKLNLTIFLDVKEIYDGYQYIAFYDGSSTKAKEFGYLKFEHGSKYKDTNYYTHTFTFSIDLDEMSSDSLCIRYNATGNGADDWSNKNLIIKSEVIHKIFV